MNYFKTFKNILMRPFFNFKRRHAAHNVILGLLLKLNKVGAFVGIDSAVFLVTSIYLSFNSVSVIAIIIPPEIGMNYKTFYHNNQGVYLS